MIKHLRREACIVTVLEFLSANDLTAVQSVSGASNSPNSGGAGGARSSSASSSSMQKRIIDGRGGGNDTFSKSSLVLSSSASTTALLRPASYQPLPTRSAFEVLACLLKRWKDDVMMEKRVGNNVDYLNVVDDVDGLIESNSEVLSRVLEVCHRVRKLTIVHLFRIMFSNICVLLF